MGYSKTDLFGERQNSMAALMKALGHPARIAIIEYLIKVKSCVCGKIVDELPLSQATVSQHLKELKEAGIIKGSIEGASVCYCLDEKAFDKIYQYTTALMDRMEKSKTNCC